MHTLIRIFLLLIISFCCFHFVSFGTGIISIIISIYCLLVIFGVLKKVQIFQNHFPPGICYLKVYQNSNSNIGDIFNQLNQFKKDNKLGDFLLIAFYYNEPGSFSQKKEKCSLGLYQKGNINNPKELDEIFVKQGFIKHELVDTKCIYCCWDYFFNFSLNIGKRKFYKLMEKKFKSNNFTEAFKIDVIDIKVSIEIYDSFEDNRVYFYIPFKNVEKYNLLEKNE